MNTDETTAAVISQFGWDQLQQSLYRLRCQVAEQAGQITHQEETIDLLNVTVRDQGYRIADLERTVRDLENDRR